VIQFLVDHIQRKNKTGLVSELPPAIDQALVAAGLKANVGPLKLLTVVQRVAVLSTAHKLKRLTNSTPDKPILGRSADALAAWLKVAHIDEGAIFRRVWKGRVGPALLPGSVASIVKRRAKLAGLEGDFGAHSLRSGFVTEAGKQGVPLPAVMAMTEHRSVASVIGYFQAGAVEENPAARLLK